MHTSPHKKIIDDHWTQIEGAYIDALTNNIDRPVVIVLDPMDALARQVADHVGLGQELTRHRGETAGPQEADYLIMYLPQADAVRFLSSIDDDDLVQSAAASLDVDPPAETYRTLVAAAGNLTIALMPAPDLAARN
jgi:hypothetical protein